MPGSIKYNTIYIIADGTEPDVIIFLCPCGCKNIVHLNLLRDTKPCWRYVLQDKSISIYPSIKSERNCGSHFWIRKSKINWA